MGRWNVIYDLGDGNGFYTDSGLNEWCEGKLNSEWFMLNEQTESVLDGEDERVSVGVGVTSTTKMMAVCLGLMGLVGAWAIISVFVRKSSIRKDVLSVSG